MATYNLTIYPDSTRKKGIRILTGQRFGRLLVIGYAGSKQGVFWHCLCDCGNAVTVRASNLAAGHQQSCSCLQKESATTYKPVHGESTKGKESAEYLAYHSAKKRCNTLSATRYDQYGGRGIEFRFDSYPQFLAHIGRKPTPQHSIERIDVNGHYEVGNVRWATNVEQQQNKRTNRNLTAFGQTLCQAEWARQTGLSVGCIAARRRANWCIECTLTIKVGQGGCLHLTKR